MEKKTTLTVTKEVWEEIKKRKDLGDTTDDVLRKALELPKKEDQ
jgi:hypothetical protein